MWHSRLPFSVVVGVSLTDLKWVGFSGSGTGWGIRLCLSRVFLSCDTRWSFYFYTSGTFRPILGLFTLFALHQFFHHVFYHAEYCFLTPHDAVDRRKETISLVCFFFFFFFLPFVMHFTKLNNHPSQIIVTLCLTCLKNKPPGSFIGD